jgi:hypothetical protein
MEATKPTRARSSVFGLFRALTGDTRTFVRQEIQLAKTEISEKLSRMGRNAVALAAGGFVAYAGLIVFVMALGWLIAWAFETAGLSPVISACLGLGIIGLVVIAVGCALLLKGLKTLSKESLTPKRTLYTLQELKGTPPPLEPAPGAKKPTSKEMQVQVEATESRMGETLNELGQRLSPRNVNASVKAKLSSRPYSAGLVAMVAGLLSGFLLRRKFRAG